VNTLQNWVNEFDHWLPSSHDNISSSRNFKLFVLNETVKSMEGRYEVITNWNKIGGVLLMGYEMYRLLSLSVPSIGGNKMATKRKKKQKQSILNDTIDLDETEKEMEFLLEIQRGLCSPGPDMVVCDEGHRIKNETTSLSHALKRIKTRRRVVLTGYPLQNNLLEYWCMVDFVRPNYLGTKQEFTDLFEKPIVNGQCNDSTQNDVRLMKYRSHVLHRLLEGFVLRRGHDILCKSLPPKFENVILLRLSPVQRVLYNLNMPQTQYMSGVPVNVSFGPLKAFAVCSKIWNHPDIYHEQATNKKMQMLDDGLPHTLSADTSCRLEWPYESIPGYEAGCIENGPKILTMLKIIDYSVSFGDKVLVYSQSLATLSHIEVTLLSHLMPVAYSGSTSGDYVVSDKKWVKGTNFCRLDGSTSSSERDRLISHFNSQSNHTCWVFLLSTKAGCLGVNLIGANRVIVLDVSWNPCYDSQAVCRYLKPPIIESLMTRTLYNKPLDNDSFQCPK
jgi:RAD54-like protein 2